ncbi:MAG: hypothetical protein IPG99_19020 [Ignavibacteria bacterium]|nr:hypothetical protein [Ignavibacteria bacterium]
MVSRFDDYYGGAEPPIFAFWWIDPAKFASYEEALKDKSKQLPTGEVDETYWVDVKKREEAGEVVTITD